MTRKGKHLSALPLYYYSNIGNQLTKLVNSKVVFSFQSYLFIYDLASSNYFSANATKKKIVFSSAC